MKKRGNYNKDDFSMEEEETLYGGQACEECTTNCLLVHGNERNPYCSVYKFFKVMLGDNFSDVLFLPPRFTHTVSEFVNQETYLEDSLGQKYKVTFSEVDDSLAFLEGWHEFSVEHSVEEGDFLVFYHIRHSRKSHFVVHVFGKSGCEKSNFPQENGVRRKRSRADANAAAPDEACKRQYMNSVGKRSLSTAVVSKSHAGNSQNQLMTTSNSLNNYNDSEKLQIVPSVIDMEEPIYMLNRDDGQNRDDRIYLYDLSSFEKQGNQSAADETNRIVNGGEGTTNHAEKHLNGIVNGGEGTNNHAEKLLNRIVNGGEGTTNHAEKRMKSQNESGLVDSFPIQREVSSPETPLCGAESHMSENIEESGPVNVTSDTRGKDFTVGHSSLRLGISSKKPAEKDNPCLNVGPVAKQENSRVFHFKDSPVSASVLKNPFGEMTKMVKEELVESREEFCGHPQLLSENTPTVQSSFAVNENDKIVKTQPVDSLDISTSAVAADPFLVVVDEQPFLLPPGSSNERRMGEKQSSSEQSAPTCEASGKQVYTSLENDALLGVKRPSKQLAASSSERLVVASTTSPTAAAAASSTISPAPATALTSFVPSVTSISPVVSDSGSGGRTPTISEMLESIRKKRKRDLNK